MAPKQNRDATPFNALDLILLGSIFMGLVTLGFRSCPWFLRITFNLAALPCMRPVF